MHTCPLATPGTPPVPHVGGPVLKGCPQVMIGFMPAARVGDTCVCVGPPDVIAKGSMGVMIGYMPAARIGDLTAHGGVITVGCPTVVIGEVGGGGGGPGGGAPGGGGGGPGGGAGGTPGTAPGGGGGGPASSTKGPFATQDEAARAALEEANPQSIADNLEYAGLIYRGADGQYYYTGPVKGTDQGANPFAAPAPPGSTVVGDYHTHADYSLADPVTGAAIRTSDPARDDFDSDNFSTTDKTGIASDGAGTPGYAGYLGTPSGTFRKYDPATGSDTAF